MPKNKDLKRLIRARMEKTGESYTAARVHLLADELPLPADYEKVAGMGDDAVARATGRAWRAWAKELDALDAASLPHADIAAKVAGILGPDASGWWAQMVTVAYERFRGLREVGQRRSGVYEVNRSRTFPVDVETLYRAIHDPAARSRWWEEDAFEITTANPGKGLRGRLPDDTRVDVYLTAKGEERSSVSIQHRNVPDRKRADTLKEVWSRRLDALGGVLSGG